ncbi:MAG: hypothetical protein LEGION0398_MBIBDBAK_01304 [Legionellaceae bacterium]
MMRIFIILNGQGKVILLIIYKISALYTGTPLYILGTTKDKAWSLVLTSSLIVWVESNRIAKTNAQFIRHWQNAAKKKLIVIIHKGSLINQDNHYLLTAYPSSIFPLAEKNSKGYKIYIPIKDKHQQAKMDFASVNPKNTVEMRLPITPKNIAYIISTLIGKPYGWGNLYFYNDCSSEMVSLYTPFGIWLPRNSRAQVNQGKMIDRSNVSSEKRIAYLIQHGHKMMTLVYIGGHIFMYLGHYLNENAKKREYIAMTYQNIWGLKPPVDNRRSIIGQSLFLPLRLTYPEDTQLNSLANRKYFQIIYLDEDPIQTNEKRAPDLKALMLPQ